MGPKEWVAGISCQFEVMLHDRMFLSQSRSYFPALQWMTIHRCKRSYQTKTGCCEGQFDASPSHLSPWKGDKIPIGINQGVKLFHSYVSSAKLCTHSVMYCV
jgi:hypothetical protein